MEKFSRKQVISMLSITPGRLRYWERLDLVHPVVEGGRTYFSLQDLMIMRRIVKLTHERVPATKLRQTVRQLAADAALQTKKPLLELRLSSLGGRVVHYQDGRLSEPISGQQIIDLDGITARADQPTDKVRTLRQDHTAEEWLAIATRTEGDASTFRQSLHAYQKVLELSPQSWEAAVNVGTLHYKLGEMREAERAYRHGLTISPYQPIVHFNLANVLDEVGKYDDALHHLREAVKMQPEYADAHFNLALLLEKMGQGDDARLHWLIYLKLDPSSEWSQLASQHLGEEAPPPPLVPVGAGTPSNVVPLRRNKVSG
jgi:tetratricopeptide (TPR) repeat protein